MPRYASLSADPRPPQAGPGSTVAWLRKNLFGNWLSALLTLFAAALVVLVGRALAEWALSVADWQVIPANLRLFLIGQYPPGLEWRPWLVTYLATFLLGLTTAIRLRSDGDRISAFAGAAVAVVLAIPVLIAALIRGPAWGAIVLTDSFALAGAAASFAPRRLPTRIAVGGWLVFFPLVVLVLLGFGRDGFFAAVGTNLWSGLLLTW